MPFDIVAFRQKLANDKKIRETKGNLAANMFVRLSYYCLANRHLSPLHVFAQTTELHKLYFNLGMTGLPNYNGNNLKAVNELLVNEVYRVALTFEGNGYHLTSFAIAILGIATLASADQQLLILKAFKDYANYRATSTTNYSPD